MTEDVGRMVKQMQKKYGEAGAMLGTDVPPVEVVSTGILSLDYALGIGGWPRGILSGIFGPPEIGKSTILGFNAIRSAQEMGKPAAIVVLSDAHVPDRDGLFLQTLIDIYAQAFICLREGCLAGILRGAQRSVES